MLFFNKHYRKLIIKRDLSSYDQKLHSTLGYYYRLTSHYPVRKLVQTALRFVPQSILFQKMSELT